MRVTFLMPGYPWRPSGGYRVVYEYANHLSALGHAVTVVHPRVLLDAPKQRGGTARTQIRRKVYELMGHISSPRVEWQRIDPTVRMAFVADSRPGNLPDGDAIFATSWQTVSSVLKCGSSAGEKFYFIQGYETWMGARHDVEATWKSPLHKVVVSRWLLNIASDLGCRDVTYIPNAVNHGVYRLISPIETRPQQIAMLFSRVPLKGTAEGVEALQMAKERHPDLQVVLFGLEHLERWVPRWMRYYRNPSQEFIVREIYNKSSIFVSPSWCEGFSLPPAEAGCCGCCVVAADSGGIREYVEDGVTGLLSPPRESSMLAQNICILLDKDQKRAELAYNIRARLASFRWEQSAAMLERMILGHSMPNLKAIANAQR